VVVRSAAELRRKARSKMEEYSRVVEKETSFMYEVMTGPGWLVLVGVLWLCGCVCMYLRGKKRRNFHTRN